MTNAREQLLAGPRRTAQRALWRRHPLLLLVVVYLGLAVTGVGLRHPWPPDEPRFALIGHDMAAGSCSPILPAINGHLYAHKPPLGMWAQAGAQQLCGSVRWSFLLPSLLAGLLVLVLVYDLARRLHGRRAGFAAALLLAMTVQFTVQARSAQLDMLLCACTTLGLYGMLRHLLRGPAWGWWTIAWAAMGLGVITKGVGFLPLFLLLPYALLRTWRHPRLPRQRGWWWGWPLGVIALATAVGIWLLPMLLATGAGAPEDVQAYRDEILFGQTAQRYQDPDHHVRWGGYFLVDIIPGMWLPGIALLPWLLRPWWRRIRRGDARILMPLLWAALVVAFFSLSPGKRGVYVFPALPAFCLAAAPMLPGLARRRCVRALALLVLVLIALAGLVAPFAGCIPQLAEQMRTVQADYAIDPRTPALALGVIAALTAWMWRRRAITGLVVVHIAAWTLVGTWVWPQMDPVRSGRRLMTLVTDIVGEQGHVALIPAQTKEQYLLQAQRPLTTFQYGRHPYGPNIRSAVAWLRMVPESWLLIEARYVRRWNQRRWQRIPVGRYHRAEWVLVRWTPPPRPPGEG